MSERLIAAAAEAGRSLLKKGALVVLSAFFLASSPLTAMADSAVPVQDASQNQPQVIQTQPAAPQDQKMASAAAQGGTNIAFRPSESLFFDVTYLGIPVGDISLMIASPTKRDGVETWPLIASGQTAAGFVFFPIKDRYVSWFNPATGLTVANEFRANENHEIRRERVTFDRANKKAHFRRDGGNMPKKELTLDVPEDAQDILAMVYRFRMAPMNTGDVFEGPVCTGKRFFIMKAAVKGTEKVTVKAGTFNTKLVHVEVAFSGKLESKREIRIFFTDDELHMPVKVDAEFFLGRITAELTSFTKAI